MTEAVQVNLLSTLNCLQEILDNTGAISAEGVQLYLGIVAALKDIPEIDSRLPSEIDDLKAAVRTLQKQSSFTTLTKGISHG